MIPDEQAPEGPAGGPPGACSSGIMLLVQVACSALKSNRNLAFRSLEGGCPRPGDRFDVDASRFFGYDGMDMEPRRENFGLALVAVCILLCPVASAFSAAF